MAESKDVEADHVYDVRKFDEPTEVDWLFEYIDSVMKSPSWDSEVMGFIDDNCMVFDNEEVRPLVAAPLMPRFASLAPCLRTVAGEQVGAHGRAREIPRGATALFLSQHSPARPLPDAPRRRASCLHHLRRWWTGS